MLQSDDAYPLYYVQFYTANSPQIYHKRFSSEISHHGIVIHRSTRDMFMFAAENWKANRYESEAVKATDYCVMLLELVVLDSSDTNGRTRLKFVELEDAQTFYRSLKKYFNRKFLEVSNYTDSHVSTIL